MSDEPVIDFMRAQFARQDEQHARTRLLLTELVQRVGALEIGQAGIRRDSAGLSETQAHMSVRLDHIAARLDRIELRLGLVDAPA